MLILKKLNIIHYWALLNIAVPLTVELVLGFVTDSNVVSGGLIYGTVLLLLMGNIYLMQRSSNLSWLIGLTLALNIAAILFMGKISFFTAIPLLPLLFSGAGAT